MRLGVVPSNTVLFAKCPDKKKEEEEEERYAVVYAACLKMMVVIIALGKPEEKSVIASTQQ